MIRKTLSISAAVLMMFFAIICMAGDKYDEAREIYEQYIPALEKYLDAVDKAENPQKLAKAINDFAGSMETLAPKMKSFAEKYPDLQKDPAVPPDYADLAKKSNDLGQRFGQSFARIAPFLDKPEVEKANEHLMNVMAGMAPEEL
jgi:hypothetical protein